METTLRGEAKFFYIPTLMYQYSYYFHIHCSVLELPVLLDVTSHFVGTLAVSRFGPVDSSSSRLVPATITLLLEVLSMALTCSTKEAARNRKDEPLNLLNVMIKNWIQAKIGNYPTTRQIFGGGMKGGFPNTNKADFVDLPREFKVLSLFFYNYYY